MDWADSKLTHTLTCVEFFMTHPFKAPEFFYDPPPIFSSHPSLYFMTSPS